MKNKYQILFLCWFLAHFSFAQNQQNREKKSDHSVTVKTVFSSSCKTLSTSEEEIVHVEGFSIYPNPVEGDFFTIKIPVKYTKVIAKVFSLSGKLVRKVKLSESEERIFVGDLSKGLYVVKLLTEREAFNFKIIKE